MTVSEAELVERDEMAILKQIWNRYGKFMLATILALVIMMFAMHYWQKRRVQVSTAASQIFQEMIYADMQQDLDGATAKGTQLIQEYKKTPYAQFASLWLAKAAIANGDLDKAVESLKWVYHNSDLQNMATHLAAVRLAAILQQQGKLDEALEYVAKDADPAYTAMYAQARGDVLVAKGELDKARAAYQLALQSLPEGVKAPLLQMKLADLGSENEA